MDGAPLGLSRRRLLQLGATSLLGALASACGGSAPTTVIPTRVEPGQQPARAAVPTGVATPNASPPQPTALPPAGNATAAPAPTPPTSSHVAVTSNADFYKVAIRSFAPKVPEDWTLAIAGDAEHPQGLGLDALKQLPAVTEMRTLECISNPAGGSLLSNAIWRGFRFSDLLEAIGIKPGVVEIRLDGLDGFYTTIPLALALDPRALVVYEMNGEPLPPEHGPPLRCLFPGHYGMKQPKWLKTVTLTSEAGPGYWDRRGWSKEAAIKVNSRIDQPAALEVLKPGLFRVSGVAFSGAAGVARVEVSFDEGHSWQEAGLARAAAPLTPYVWTNWQWSGAVPARLKFNIIARATDMLGQTQKMIASSLLSNAFPDGTDDMHRISVRVQG